MNEHHFRPNSRSPTHRDVRIVPRNPHYSLTRCAIQRKVALDGGIIGNLRKSVRRRTMSTVDAGMPSQFCAVFPGGSLAYPRKKIANRSGSDQSVMFARYRWNRSCYRLQLTGETGRLRFGFRSLTRCSETLPPCSMKFYMP